VSKIPSKVTSEIQPGDIDLNVFSDSSDSDNRISFRSTNGRHLLYLIATKCA